MTLLSTIKNTGIGNFDNEIDSVGDYTLTVGGTEKFRVATTGLISTAYASVTTPVALTDGATVAWDWSVAQNATLSIAGSRTLSNPTNPINGQYSSIRVVRSGVYSLSFDTLFKGITGITQSTTSGSVDHFVFRYNGTNFELVSFRANVGA